MSTSLSQGLPNLPDASFLTLNNLQKPLKIPHPPENVDWKSLVGQGSRRASQSPSNGQSIRPPRVTKHPEVQHQPYVLKQASNRHPEDASCNKLLLSVAEKEEIALGMKNLQMKYTEGTARLKLNGPKFKFYLHR